MTKKRENTSASPEQTSRKFKAPNRDTWVKGKLRQMSLRWPPRSEALRRSRADRGLYKCAMCHDVFKMHQVHLDHKVPVIALDQKEFNWTNFIERLFCDVEGFQVLCTTCHDAKTAIEDQMRMFFRHGENPPQRGKKK